MLVTRSFPESSVFRCMSFFTFHPCFLILEADEWFLLRYSPSVCMLVDRLCIKLYLVILTDVWRNPCCCFSWFYSQLCLYVFISCLMIYLTVEEGTFFFPWACNRVAIIVQIDHDLFSKLTSLFLEYFAITFNQLVPRLFIVDVSSQLPSILCKFPLAE